MRLFVNFAPLTFGGGSERWMLDVSSEVSKVENTALIDVDPKLSNIYGRLVLKRAYDKRLSINLDNKKQQNLSLTFFSFIPSTTQWHKARSSFTQARSIYIRYEFLESFLVLYFGGKSALNKTIAGIHSPFTYTIPQGFSGHLHNLLYESFISIWLLRQMHKVHVLNAVDHDRFTKKFHLKEVVLIPNFIPITEEKKISTQLIKKQKEKLAITFVGELSLRKGIDILIKTVRKSPEHFIYHIIGDGPMHDDVEKLIAFPNVHYHGFLEKEKVQKIMASSDILFVPSRAESFSLACLEAMTYGLPLISSKDIKMGLPGFVQRINKTGSSSEYIKMFKKIFKEKNAGKLKKEKMKIKQYAKNNFSRDVVIHKLLQEVFEQKTA